MATKKLPEEIALHLARTLARTNQFHEDLEPGEVAWLLRTLVKKVKAQQRVIYRLETLR